MPPSDIEPVNLQGQRSKPFTIRGRGPREVSDQDVKEAELNNMMSLLHSHMFIEQGIKLKWIRERILRYNNYGGSLV